MKQLILINIAATLAAALGLTSCSSAPMYASPSLNPSSSRANLSHPTFWQGDTTLIWNRLQHTSSARLMAASENSSDDNQKAWSQLALISKQDSTRTHALVNALLAWRTKYPDHPGNALFPETRALQPLLYPKTPQHIVLLLPLKTGAYRTSGKRVREGFLNAYYASPSSLRPSISMSDTSFNTDMTALYRHATDQGADFVIGPLEKNNVRALGNSGPFNAPVLALNYTHISAGSLPSQLYQFGLLPEDEIIQMADRATSRGLSKALIIAPENTWGKRLTSAFSARWRARGGNIQDTWYFTQRTNFSQDIAKLLGIDTTADKKLMTEDNHKTTLEKQRRQDFDVIILFAQPQSAALIVPTLKYYYVNDVPIYANATVYTGKMAKDVDLNGVTICDVPLNIHGMGGDAESRRLYAVGQDAYLLSQSMQRLADLPNFPIYGKTGALTLSSTHQIHRRVPCVTIHNGRV